jgi:two-component system, chemotaxis family, sensor kinase Cph1
MVDLTDCDREPIHVPGTVQPFGVLLVLNSEMRVVQVSENVSDHLSMGAQDVLGRPLSDLVDPSAADEVREGEGALARCEPAAHQRIGEVIRWDRSPP